MHSRWITLAAACLLWAVPARAQQQPQVPRGVFAMEFDYGTNPSVPVTVVRIKNVTRGGPADLAGLRSGDVILKLNDQPVAPDTWWEIMRDIPPGTQVVVTYVRGGQTASATVTVGDRVETYTRLASAGDADAAMTVGEIYWVGQSVPKNKDEGLRWYRRAAELGSSPAAFALGQIYYHGNDVPKDFNEALRWYRTAAERGNILAAAQAGWMYAHAQGAPLNGPEAVRWLNQAVAGNYPPAEFSLGLVYGYGMGVSRDFGQAAYWYRKAAEHEVSGAMTNLGVLYVNGTGVEKNLYEAISWYRRAAEKGEPYAQHNLASCYYNGTGVAQDYAEADFWWALAKANAYPDADAVLDTLPQKLTAQQTAEVQRRVAAWMSANVTLTTEPPLASVYFNNQYRGASDANGRLELHDLAAGQYVVRVSASGYTDATSTFFFPAHGAYSPTIKLKPASADLRFQTTPGGAQVYLNDEFKGASSADGTLVVPRLPKGSYRVRVSLSGYNDWNQNVEVRPGPPMPVVVALERSGPPPLTLDDVLGLLGGSVSPVRVATLVKERGVDFEVNDEVEKRIRDAGGDSELLLAIARNHKK